MLYRLDVNESVFRKGVLMSSRMLKYLLCPTDHFGEHVVEMPQSADIKHIGLQISPYGSGVMAWCEVITEKYSLPRVFVLIATGEEVPEKGTYMKTIEFPSGTVWHLYELKE